MTLPESSGRARGRAIRDGGAVSVMLRSVVRSRIAEWGGGRWPLRSTEEEAGDGRDAGLRGELPRGPDGLHGRPPRAFRRAADRRRAALQTMPGLDEEASR